MTRLVGHTTTQCSRLTGKTKPPVALGSEPRVSADYQGVDVNSVATQDGPTSVYRYFDADGVLLYVGITGRGAQRNGQHAKDKEWWTFVARQEVEHLPSRAAALDLERDLVRAFSPPFNKQHNPHYDEMRAHYLSRQSADVEDDPLRLYTSLQKRLPLVKVSDRGREVLLATKLEHAAVAQNMFMKGRAPVRDAESCGEIVSLELYGRLALLRHVQPVNRQPDGPLFAVVKLEGLGKPLRFRLRYVTAEAA